MDKRGPDSISGLPPVVVQRHVLPFLEPTDLMALYHCSHHWCGIVSSWGGWRQLYRQHFPDAVAEPSGTPFEQYLVRAKAQVYILWLVPNEKPQIVGPTPPFAVRKICSSALFATILSTSGHLYAVEPKVTPPQGLPRNGRAPSRPQDDSKLSLTRMRHLENRFNPKFVNVWGSHGFTHALTDKNELYLWYTSDMRGFRITFGNEQLGVVRKVVSCISNSWHVALIGERILWWTSDFTGDFALHNQPFAIKTWEYFGEGVLDVEIIGSRLLLLERGAVHSYMMGQEGEVSPSEAIASTFPVSEQVVRMGSCLSILTLFNQDGSTIALDINYPEIVLLKDASQCTDIFFRPNSTWKLCGDGKVYHWSSYNWANGLLWSPPTVTPLSIAAPSSLLMDSTFKWTSPPTATRQPIVLDPSAAENLSAAENPKSIFMHRAFQIAHQYTQNSLSMHLALLEPSVGDIFSSSVLQASAPSRTQRRPRKSIVVESEPRSAWRSLFCS